MTVQELTKLNAVKQVDISVGRYQRAMLGQSSDKKDAKENEISKAAKLVLRPGKKIMLTPPPLDYGEMPEETG